MESFDIIAIIFAALFLFIFISVLTYSLYPSAEREAKQELREEQRRKEIKEIKQRLKGQEEQENKPFNHEKQKEDLEKKKIKEYYEKLHKLEAEIREYTYKKEIYETDKYDEIIDLSKIIYSSYKNAETQKEKMGKPTYEPFYIEIKNSWEDGYANFIMKKIKPLLDITNEEHLQKLVFLRTKGWNEFDYNYCPSLDYIEEDFLVANGNDIYEHFYDTLGDILDEDAIWKLCLELNECFKEHITIS